MRGEVLWALMAVALVGAVSSPAAAQARVGVYPSSTLSAADAATLERAIAAQGGFAAVDLATMKDYVVAAEGIGVVCADANPDCLARVVAVSGLPYALWAMPVVEGDRAFMRLVLIDGSGDNFHRQVDLQVTTSGDSRAAGLTAGVAHLLMRTALTGGVRLSPAPDDNATVMVDGSRMLRFDLEQLDAGRRQIAVVDRGQRWEAEVDVLAGVTTDVTLTLVESPPDELAPEISSPAPTAAAGGLPVLPIALLAGGAAVGVVGVVGGAGSRPAPS